MMDRREFGRMVGAAGVLAGMLAAMPPARAPVSGSVNTKGPAGGKGKPVSGPAVGEGK
jgi:hypothetical protein